MCSWSFCRCEWRWEVCWLLLSFCSVFCAFLHYFLSSKYCISHIILEGIHQYYETLMGINVCTLTVPCTQPDPSGERLGFPVVVPVRVCFCSRTKIGVHGDLDLELRRWCFFCHHKKDRWADFFGKTHLRQHFSSIDSEILHHPVNLKFLFFLMQRIWRYPHFVKLFFQKVDFTWGCACG